MGRTEAPNRVRVQACSVMPQQRSCALGDYDDGHTKTRGAPQLAIPARMSDQIRRRALIAAATLGFALQAAPMPRRSTSARNSFIWRMYNCGCVRRGAGIRIIEYPSYRFSPGTRWASKLGKSCMNNNPPQVPQNTVRERRLWPQPSPASSLASARLPFPLPSAPGPGRRKVFGERRAGRRCWRKLDRAGQRAATAFIKG